MIEVKREPRVSLIGWTEIDEKALAEWLLDNGFGGWYTRQKRLGEDFDAQKLVEIAGRTCYLSFGVGVHNPNLKRVREGCNVYLQNACFKQKHGSILEHASATFVIDDISRVATHELVRHRHLSFSQQSLRYVLLSGRPIGFRPPSNEGALDPRDEDNLVGAVKRLYGEYLDLSKIVEEESNSRKRKILTSGLRRMLPMGITQSIWVSGNVRAWRHFLALRLGPHAEEEIRAVARGVVDQLEKKFPLFFPDVVRDEEGYAIGLEKGSF
ncbi:MAG: FAD-dependent thymidylate synthase [Deltaproteobacteria bacterium]|nr:MAG: FAD-dependent thymidylate synthase [Deltaproteobacteria bacterium]